ncbi:hypothetical protein [Nocardia sp. GAS34]|uniref:hypothetical protein n=1 Tax=unclassified Nocardia TaxID=2637762 RepID=UPI003D197093
MPGPEVDSVVSVPSVGQRAAVWIRADGDAGAVPAGDDFPVLSALCARWAVIAVAFTAVGSQWGPRILAALGMFEGAARCGATVAVRPGGRAVLSGEVWNAPELDGGRNEDIPMLDVYADAPGWVADRVLDPWEGHGLLSFCHWWEGGESPAGERLGSAVPGVWTAGTVIDVVCGVLSSDPAEELRSAVATLVAAAEAGVVTRETLAAVFTDPGDVDDALQQLSLAGLVITVPGQLPRDRAIMLVREYIEALIIDATNYRLDELAAERLGVGWVVTLPTQPGVSSLGRALFYIADDGVIEQSLSSVAPSLYIEGFERRFQQRRAGAMADLSIR